MSKAEAKELIDGIFDKRREVYVEACLILSDVTSGEEQSPLRTYRMAKHVARIRRGMLSEPTDDRQIMQYSILKAVEKYFEDKIREAKATKFRKVITMRPIEQSREFFGV